MLLAMIVLCVVMPSALAADPQITVDKSVSPNEIYLKGDGGTPDTSNVVLSIVGTGDPIPGKETFAPTDVVFVIDDTGSMGDDIDEVKVKVNELTDTLTAEIPDIRFGLVTYGDTFAGETHRDLDLTSDVGAFRASVNALYASGGGDWLESVEDGLKLGYESSWRTSGDVAKVVVLIGDAPPHDTALAVSEASAAYVNEYGTYTNTIACAVDGTTDVVFMDIATAGHGTYTTKTSSGGLVDAIIASIKKVVPSIDTAGENVVVTEVVPTYIEATNFNPAPTTSSGNTFTWDFGKVGIGETKTITFDAKCTEAGDHKLVDVYPDTAVVYNAWGGSAFDKSVTLPFPETYINCKTSKDVTPPVITTSGKPVVLWPPNGKYHSVSLSDFGISATDAGDPTVDASQIVITSVSSDEPEEATSVGDKKTLEDIVIKSSQSVDLRAERQGTGNGRVYTINYQIADAAGNVATGFSQVWCPHDQDTGATAVDDGAAAGYIVSY